MHLRPLRCRVELNEHPTQQYTLPLGAIAKTANYVADRASARFKWLLCSAIVQPEAHDNGTP